MSGTVTIKHHCDSAKLFVDSVNRANSSFFVFTARSYPWENDNSPPAANAQLTVYEHQIYDDILFGKRIANTDVKFMIPRYDWTSNTVYARYSKNNANLYNTNFYVITADRRVYKVLDNNGNTASTIKPFASTNTVFVTSDGYVWKYMYTIDASTMTAFATPNYIPIVPNTAVQNSALPGAIDVILVDSGGSGYQTYHTGSLQQVVSSSIVALAANSSAVSNFYTNSAIYFKSGLGAGQLRTITGYTGTTRTASLNAPINFYLNLVLANTVGTFLIGETVEQDCVELLQTSVQGTFEVGDTVTQSVTGATGTIISSKETQRRIRLNKTVGSPDFAIGYVVDSGDAPTLGAGTVTANTTSNTVVGVGTSFTSFFPVGTYLKIGDYTHRVTAVANGTSLTVAGPFAASFSANVYYKVPSAGSVLSVTNYVAEGVTAFTNLNGVELSITNRAKQFIIGEYITQPQTSSNGVVVFANTSTLIVSDVDGPGFQQSNSTVTCTILGSQSAATANVATITTMPSITLQNVSGSFIFGGIIRTAAGAQAKVQYTNTLPDEETEYVVSPKVTITGDGLGAEAYSVVNTSNFTISSIVVINGGSGYTEANAVVTANGSIGSGASLDCSIGPVKGHGYDPVYELGGRYVMVVSNFNNPTQEGYSFPGYGSYRQVGLIRNPYFADVTVGVNNYQRANLVVRNATGNYQSNDVVQQGSGLVGRVLTVSGPTSNQTLHVENLVLTTGSDWEANTDSGDTLTGLLTGSVSNVAVATTVKFAKGATRQFVYQQNSGGFGTLLAVANDTIRLTNTQGIMVAGISIVDPMTNTYAIPTSFALNNGQKSTQFNKFSHLARLTLSSNTLPFIVNEEIEQQTELLGTKLAWGRIYSTNNEVDLIVSGNSIPFTLYETLIQSGTAASGVLFAGNSTHLKLTEVSGQFIAGNSTYKVTGQTSTAEVTVANVRPVLVISGADGTFGESPTNYLVGLTSGANGFVGLSNTVILPELVRESGEVLYIENRSPITRAPDKKETVRLMIKF